MPLDPTYNSQLRSSDGSSFYPYHVGDEPQANAAFQRGLIANPGAYSNPNSGSRNYSNSVPNSNLGSAEVHPSPYGADRSPSNGYAIYQGQRYNHPRQSSQINDNITMHIVAGAFSILLVIGGLSLGIFSLWQSLMSFLNTTADIHILYRLGYGGLGVIHFIGFLIAGWTIATAAFNLAPRLPAKWVIVRRVNLVANLIAFSAFLTILVFLSLGLQHFYVFLTLICYCCCCCCFVTMLFSECARGTSDSVVQSSPFNSGSENVNRSTQQHRDMPAASSSATNAGIAAVNSDDWTDELPPGWGKKFDTQTQNYYYVDYVNRRTTWIHPMLQDGIQTETVAPSNPVESVPRVQAQNPDSKQDNNSSIYPLFS